MARRAHDGGRARPGDRRHRQCHRPQPRRAARSCWSARTCETQPHAGWLDGALGVIYALEAARAIARRPGVRRSASTSSPRPTRKGITASFIGSRSFIGPLDEAEIDAAHEPHDGKPLRDALARGRLRRPAARADRAGALQRLLRGAYRAGRHARELRAAIGIVTGDRRHLALPASRSTGEQNHAGTTRMAARKDAGPGAGAPAGRDRPALPRGRRAARTVWTTGRITLDPGAPSIIPGRAEMLFQFRDTDPAVLERLEAELHALVAEATHRAVPVAIAPISAQSMPAADGRGFQEAIERRPARTRRAHMRMPSGAGHDAQILARACGRDAVRAQHRRHQPPLGRGHQRRGHRARLSGVFRCDCGRVEGLKSTARRGPVSNTKDWVPARGDERGESSLLSQPLVPAKAGTKQARC